MSAIPQRIYYSIREAAELTGMSEDYVREKAIKGRRRTPPDDAIPLSQQRMFGTQVRIHRSWVFPEEPANVTALRQRALTPDQIEAAMGAALVRFAQEFIQGFAEKRKGAA
jgi:hypothetical protein